MKHKSKFICLGNFDVLESKHISEFLEKNNIAFEVDIDDSAIKNMHPIIARYGGTFGGGVQIIFYIHPDTQEECQQLLNELYPV